MTWGRPSSTSRKSSLARSGTILPCLSRTVASTLTVFTSTAILGCSWPARLLPERVRARTTAARIGFPERDALGAGALPNLAFILLLRHAAAPIHFGNWTLVRRIWFAAERRGVA